MTMFFCGDVMVGRGVDQILRHPSGPQLHEPFVSDAREYVQLAEATSGAVPRRALPTYVWGDALPEWEGTAPAVRVANLETSVTRRDEYCTAKSIHYRMHPWNVDCVKAARFDVCVLANNHVLDFGRRGLVETLETLENAGIACAGAGRTLSEARRPVVCALPGGRRLVLAACAHESSGVPDHWAARADRAGVHLLPDLREETAASLAVTLLEQKRPGDVAAVSIHWGGNWGYGVPHEHVAFAHGLVDAGVDLVHGHSSHHVRPIEIYRERLILYGCGDFLNDYEGIVGYEEYRADLALMFFPSVDVTTGRLAGLRMTPLRIRRLRLHRASADDARWLCDRLDRVCRPFGARMEVAADGALTLVHSQTTGSPFPAK